MSLEGRVAIVAGASRGIGADIALHLARAGARVAVAARTEAVRDPRLPGTIYSVAEDIAAAGGIALPVVLNLRDPESIAAAVARVVAEWGRIDILVHNAAIFVPSSDLAKAAPRHINVSIDVNVRGPVLTMQAVLPHLRAVGGGHIINISGSGGTLPGAGPYADAGALASGDSLFGPGEAFVQHFSQTQARLLQRDGVSVNVLMPVGRVRTPGNIFAENDPANPVVEFEHAHEMGKAAVWICTQPADRLNGSILIDRDVCSANRL
ncbi:MAG: SDR family NAD(P)-dependent oxidoreductase [Dehalococcoidia bacterium]|nr:SDR family NAD(P)-dependent oxidoreductase [Dehalococcoidia bacterium]